MLTKYLLITYKFKVHEGPLDYVENGRVTETYTFLFNDMFVVTKTKKSTTKSKLVRPKFKN
jgi:hypothetical protein